jgi:hypothetical protein
MESDQMKKNRFAGLATGEQKQSEFVTFDELKARSTPRLMRMVDTQPIGDLQIRSEGIDAETSTNKAWVDELVAKMLRNPDLKCEGDLVIAGVKDEDGNIIRVVRLDGNHFITAALIVAGDKANDLELQVKYVECSATELESASYGTNATHGLQLNNKEKVLLARRLLKKYPDLTDGAIEKLAPVLIAKTIGNQRRWLAENENVYFPSKRRTLEGKWMETASIGSVRPTEASAPALGINGADVPEWAKETAPVAPTNQESVKAEVVLSPEQQAAAKRGRFIPVQESGGLPEAESAAQVSGKAAQQQGVSKAVSDEPQGESLSGGGIFYEFEGVGFLVNGAEVGIENIRSGQSFPISALVSFVKAYRQSQVKEQVENIGK